MKKRKIFFPAIVAFALAFALTHGAAASDRNFPTPQTISERTAAMVDAPGTPVWRKTPESTEALRVMARSTDQKNGKSAAALAERFGVKIEESKITGVTVRTITPRTIDEDKKDNTVRMHTRLLLAGAHAELVVHEALSHGQYYFDSDAPETANHYKLIDMFLDEQLLTEK